MFYHILWWSCVGWYIIWFDADWCKISWLTIWIGEFKGGFALLFYVLTLCCILWPAEDEGVGFVYEVEDFFAVDYYRILSSFVLPQYRILLLNNGIHLGMCAGSHALHILYFLPLKHLPRNILPNDETIYVLPQSMFFLLCHILSTCHLRFHFVL